jgi:saccharopine dehydrogenase-like NADP-dependent oxidoreductase
MNVVVIGGYGVFGGRLAQLLLRDGHEVWIAGRNLQKAEKWAARHGGCPLRLDLSQGLAPIREVAPRAVVDAAGPFQTRDSDPYRVARFCIEHRINYLDLSDDPAFTAGIQALDSAARAIGCFALSGASSVPAISSAAVAEIAADLASIEVIEGAILPGNRAPRGHSVIAGILSQIGTPMRVWRGGQWREIRSWSDRQIYRLGHGLRRSAWSINVPDLTLFPDFFAARSVMFRAGMELAVLNRALSVLVVLRRSGFARKRLWQVSLVQRASAMLMPFGSDRGGMAVYVTGTKEGLPVRRCWHLIAEAGEGPFVPGLAVRALLRRAERIPPGARPCLGEATLGEIEEAMSDLAVKTQRTEEARPTLFQVALADRWNDLPPTVRRLHSVQDMESFSGRAWVERGTAVIARLAAWFFRFPDAGDDVPLTITKTRTASGEIWERDFAGRVFRSYLTRSRSYHYKERFSAFNYEQELPVRNGVLHFWVLRGWFLGIPIPKPLLPRSESREFELDGAFHFDVALFAPLGGGLIVRYRGSLSPDGRET